MSLHHIFALLCLVLLPFAEFHLLKVGFNLSPPNAAAALFAVLILYWGITHPKNWLMPSYGILSCLGAFIMLVVGGNLYHLPLKQALSASTPCIGAGLLFFVAFTVASHIHKSHWEAAILASTLLPPIIGLGHIFGIVPYFEPLSTLTSNKSFELFGVIHNGATGLMKSRGSYGISGIVGLAIGMRWILHHNPLKRLAGVFSSLVIVTGLIMSLSRSTWVATLIFYASLAVLFGLFRILTKNPKKRGIHPGIILCSILAVALLGTFLLWPVIQEANNRLIAMSPKTVQTRIKSYRLALDVISDHPLIGLGPKFEHNVLHVKHIVHNTFLRVAASYGSMAAVTLSAFIIWTYGNLVTGLIKTEDRKRRYYLIIWIAAMTGAMVEMNLFSGEFSKQFWALAGLASAEYHPNNSQAHERTALIEGSLSS
ncbi:MAG: O-antigen ligase family protein [Proteobacteria bacterium]|nr:O-antigen ligase family protein [Pseudomonadota bacterium]